MHRRTALVDVREYTTTRNGGADERVKLLVAADRELQVPRRDALHAQVLGRIAWGSGGSYARKRTCELKHLSSEILEDRARVHGGFRADADVVLRARLEVAVDTADRELRVSRRYSDAHIPVGRRGPTETRVSAARFSAWVQLLSCRRCPPP